MDEVVRDAGMIGILLVERLEDLDGLDEVVHRLVVEGLVQRESVEDLRLDVGRILPGERFHGLLVVLPARVLIDRLVILVELLDRREPVALALRLGADRLALFDRVEAALERGRVERAHQRIRTLADGDAPVRDRAAGISLRDRRERLDRFREEEGVEHREGALELLLRFGRTGGLEEDPAELLAARLRGIVVRGSRGGEDEGRQNDDEGSDPAAHIAPPRLASRAPKLTSSAVFRLPTSSVRARSARARTTACRRTSSTRCGARCRWATWRSRTTWLASSRFSRATTRATSRGSRS